MSIIDDIKFDLMNTLTPKRYKHSIGVMDTARDMARVFGADEEKAALAGLVHDCARDIRGEEVFQMCDKYNIYVDEICRIQPELLHGPLGSRIAEEKYGIRDKEILDAIYWHTTGHENMAILEKIILVADCVEPSRNYPGVDKIRYEAFRNIDRAVVLTLDSTLKYVIDNSRLVHMETLKARNYILLSEINGARKDN